ncbi:MAG: phage integrase N-terminal SAM-like domain-containing protein [Actinomycetota bacterium]
MYKGRARYRKETRHGQASEPSPGSEPTQAVRSLRDLIRRLRFSIRTEQGYVDWIRRFIMFRGKQHPEGRGAVAGEAFLTALAVNSNVASSTRNHAPNAMALLYGQILRKGFGLLGVSSVPGSRPGERSSSPATKSDRSWRAWTESAE